MENKKYIKEFGINVNRFLSYAEIQAIADTVKGLKGWAERETNIDLFVLHFATDIPKKDLENFDHNKYLESGLIDAVKSNIENIDLIYKALAFEESPIRILIDIAKKMPEFSEQIKKVTENATSKK